ncbi:protein of unknown function [Lishizhenia tianjinensis]|uniref:DUF4956 domain-containing protein n=1 Tax=Lishizhenia tianjinensis TaxID=477690 RepID=A0A1I6ZP16_9FLAO|nr:DUF4956 domain-containing protein [Lishizhenia tianjinensis]SFT64453.1 protein of unknown function [Lishizhenia tianjinensis]
MLLNIFSNISDLMDLQITNKDVYTLMFRLIITLIFLTIIIRFLYYPKTKRKDYLFTYYLIGLVTFFLCFGLKKLDIDTGMGLGLFAIFGIIRYRTNPIEIKEMTYLFIVIGVSVINSLSSKQISVVEMSIVNATLILLTYGLEYLWLLKHETRKTVIYEKIDLIKPEKEALMLADLEERTGLKINRFEIGKIDFLKDVAEVRIFYYDDEQHISDYNSSTSENDLA